MSAAMTAQLVSDALVMAIWRRGEPDALLHLLDEPIGQRLGQRRDGKLLLVTQNRAHRAQVYRTQDEAKADVFDYIEPSTIRNAGTRGSVI